jgi:hypothetical protein
VPAAPAGRAKQTTVECSAVRRRLQCIISRRPSVGAIAANRRTLCAPPRPGQSARQPQLAYRPGRRLYATARRPQYYTVRLVGSRTVGRKHFIKTSIMTVQQKRFVNNTHTFVQNIYYFHH